MPWHECWGWHWGWMPFFPVLVLVLIVLWLIFGRRGKPFLPPGGPGGPSEAPIEIAKRRYARGEITKEQFEEIKKTLG